MVEKGNIGYDLKISNDLDLMQSQCEINKIINGKKNNENKNKFYFL
jgi:5'-3' exonuclease